MPAMAQGEKHVKDEPARRVHAQEKAHRQEAVAAVARQIKVRLIFALFYGLLVLVELLIEEAVCLRRWKRGLSAVSSSH